jgi:small subunit ribosomal protein S16
MAVKIRLSRVGKKKAPFYRIVAIDSRKKRDGQFIEDLGTYNPLTGELIQFHQERINDWISKGAIPTESVLKIQKMYVKQKSATA